VADAQQNAYSKARDRRMAKLVVKSQADAPMVASPQEKEQQERQQLLRQFNKAMTDRRRTLLEGKYRDEVRGLVQFLDTLDMNSAPGLMSYLAKCQWFQHCDYGTRFDILSVIDLAIVRFRVRSGQPPFDDSIDPEPPTAFQVIRHHMTGVGAAS
jgi:hypothetical protein